MGDWSLMRKLLESAQEPSTVVGRICVPIFFIFRILVLVAATVEAWGGEVEIFTCNTQMTGCRETCYNVLTPISHIRFWVLQLICVSVSTLAYLAYILHLLRMEEKHRQQSKGLQLALQSDTQPLLDQSNAAKVPVRDRQGRAHLRRILLRTYIFSIVFTIAIEVVFVVGQCRLYGFSVPAHYMCNTVACPHRVDCYVPRATEKTAAILFMLAAACVSLLINLVEMNLVCLFACCPSLKHRCCGPAAETGEEAIGLSPAQAPSPKQAEQ